MGVDHAMEEKAGEMKNDDAAIEKVGAGDQGTDVRLRL